MGAREDINRELVTAQVLAATGNHLARQASDVVAEMSNRMFAAGQVYGTAHGSLLVELVNQCSALAAKFKQAADHIDTDIQALGLGG